MMDTGWIQVFVLTLSECVAPEGKTVCQEREFELQFLDRGQCELALEQLVGLKRRVDNVIVDENASRCAPSARRHEVYANLAEINAAHAGSEGWQPPPAESEATGDDNTREAHRQRLAQLAPCSDTGGVAPCKVGEIIVEKEPPKKIEVWREGNQ
jgi:hypothetical protein